MAKRTKASKTNSASSGTVSARLVKLHLNDEELKELRVAAAISDCRVSEFARKAALETAASTIREKYSSSRR